MFATLTEFASGSAGTIVVITGTFAGCARTIAILRKWPEWRIEWMTAVGFVVGAFAMILLVCADAFLKWS